MIISHSRRFTFIHVSKTGGTCVENALEPHLRWNDLYLGGTVMGQHAHDAFQQRFGLHKHSSVAEVERICGSHYVTDFYLFALVRHPLHRMCSLYNFVGCTVLTWAKLRGVDPSQMSARAEAHEIAADPFRGWAATTAFLSSSSFSDFIRHESLRWDVAFLPQASRLCRAEGGKPQGEIFRLEDVPSGLWRLRQALSLDLALERENVSPVTLIAPEQVCAADHRYIEEVYAADYAAFGY